MLEVRNRLLKGISSESPLYEEEKEFRKPYVIRWITKDEYESLRKNKPEFVEIQNAKQKDEYFIRRIIAIHQLDEKEDKCMVGITMDKVIVEIYGTKM